LALRGSRSLLSCLFRARPFFYFNDYETRLVLRGVVELQNTKTPSFGIAARCLFFFPENKGQ